MRIGILGSGTVGQVLAHGFIKHGYEVMLSTRSPEKLSDWKQKAGKHARIGRFSETAAFGEMIVVAVMGTTAKDALDVAGAEKHKGKTIIDATNPITERPT